MLECTASQYSAPMKLSRRVCLVQRGSVVQDLIKSKAVKANIKGSKEKGKGGKSKKAGKTSKKKGKSRKKSVLNDEPKGPVDTDIHNFDNAHLCGKYCLSLAVPDAVLVSATQPRTNRQSCTKGLVVDSFASPSVLRLIEFCISVRPVGGAEAEALGQARCPTFILLNGTIFKSCRTSN